MTQPACGSSLGTWGVTLQLTLHNVNHMQFGGQESRFEGVVVFNQVYPHMLNVLFSLKAVSPRDTAFKKHVGEIMVNLHKALE